MFEKLGFLRSGRETWPSWPSSRFPQPDLPLWWLCRSPEGVCSHPACSLESELVGLPEGLVMSGVPLATLATPAWSSPLLGNRDIPHTNSALSSIFLLPPSLRLPSTSSLLVTAAHVRWQDPEMR